ncbi:hypothetical protein L345_09618, partial [Ophiophagus hannah]
MSKIEALVILSLLTHPGPPKCNIKSDPQLRQETLSHFRQVALDSFFFGAAPPILGYRIPAHSSAQVTMWTPSGKTFPPSYYTEPDLQSACFNMHVGAQPLRWKLKPRRTKFQLSSSTLLVGRAKTGSVLQTLYLLFKCSHSAYLVNTRTHADSLCQEGLGMRPSFSKWGKRYLPAFGRPRYLMKGGRKGGRRMRRRKEGEREGRRKENEKKKRGAEGGRKEGRRMRRRKEGDRGEGRRMKIRKEGRGRRRKEREGGRKEGF